MAADAVASQLIERLTFTLSALAALPAGQIQTPAGRRLADDCADAVRLALDCPQHELTPRQRHALRTLGDLLDAGNTREEMLRAALRSARAAVGVGTVQAGDERSGGP